MTMYRPLVLMQKCAIYVVDDVIEERPSSHLKDRKSVSLIKKLYEKKKSFY